MEAAGGPSSRLFLRLLDAVCLALEKLVIGHQEREISTKQHRLAVPLLQRTEQTFSAMILGCGG